MVRHLRTIILTTLKLVFFCFSTDSIGDFGGIKWWMLVCLVVSWLIVYAITMKGIQSSGKVVYFTAMFPYLVLTIFFVR